VACYGRTVVFCEERVDTAGEDVFGVDEEAVHVEDAGADGWKAGDWCC